MTYGLKVKIHNTIRSDPRTLGACTTTNDVPRSVSLFRTWGPVEADVGVTNLHIGTCQYDGSQVIQSQ